MDFLTFFIGEHSSANCGRFPVFCPIDGQALSTSERHLSLLFPVHFTRVLSINDCYFKIFSKKFSRKIPARSPARRIRIFVIVFTLRTFFPENPSKSPILPGLWYFFSLKNFFRFFCPGKAPGSQNRGFCPLITVCYIIIMYTQGLAACRRDGFFTVFANWG